MFYRKSIQEFRIDYCSLFLRPSSFIHVVGFIRGNNNLFDWNAKMFCKFKITLIMPWNGHNSSCSIANQYIISNPNWNRKFGKGMLHITTCKNATNGIHICLSLALTAIFCLLNICFNCCFLFRSCNF